MHHVVFDLDNIHIAVAKDIGEMKSVICKPEGHWFQQARARLTGQRQGGGTRKGPSQFALTSQHRRPLIRGTHDVHKSIHVEIRQLQIPCRGIPGPNHIRSFEYDVAVRKLRCGPRRIVKCDGREREGRLRQRSAVRIAETIQDTQLVEHIHRILIDERFKIPAGRLQAVWMCANLEGRVVLFRATKIPKAPLAIDRVIKTRGNFAIELGILL